MREAFGALAALKQIDVANGRRAKVGAIDGSVMAASIDHAVATAQISFADVWDVRRTVELRVAALAAQNRSDMEADELLRLAAAMRAAAQADDMVRMVEHDIALHQAIARASGNPLFAQMVRSYAVPMRQAVPQAWQTRRTRDQTEATLDRHYEIARTIADRNVDAAIAAMNGHFDTAIEDLLRKAG
jgi:DNA-binding FadR family transcriptional regulator